MPLSGDMIAAFDLGITKDDPAAAALFSGTDKLLILGDEVWLPLSMGHFNEGFMAAWDAGIAGITALFADENAEAEFFDVENAWGIYPPAPLPGQGGAIRPPDASALAAAAEGALGRYIANELTPKINALNAQIRAAPTPALYNQLGMVYMRSGRIAEAKTNYERAAGMGSVPAMVNRGNIALQEKDGATAERWYRQVLTLNPGYIPALRGLEQAANAR
jgi:tetratricopeptide (TPR) repeat protein